MLAQIPPPNTYKSRNAISKLLRHSTINMTEKYLSEFDTATTDKAMADIFFIMINDIIDIIDIK